MAKPFVFVYLPKTGTSPLLAHLGRRLVWNEGIVFLGPWGNRQRHREGRPDPSVWSSTKRAQIKVITGTDVDTSSHEICGAAKGRYFTVIRDPADRLVSEYNALVDRGDRLPDFWSWHADRRFNQTTRRFRELFGVETADEISERLRDFWFVTTTEHLEDDVPHLLAAIGAPGEWKEAPGGSDADPDDDDLDATDTGEIAAIDPPAPGRVEVTDELRARVYLDHPKDRRLHKLALKRRAARRAKLGWE